MKPETFKTNVPTLLLTENCIDHALPQKQSCFFRNKKEVDKRKKPNKHRKNFLKIFNLEAIFEPETLENETRRF